ncbi:MAG: hypothetical protein KIPDCIKN_00057 [Haliscomenobacter sp.]|jgi:glycosyltransferase involved in cell wall biosynthesis|nr:hypothetical protein [Haliscomenobacter sp.]
MNLTTMVVPHIVCHLTTQHTRFDPRIFQKECLGLANAGYSVTLYVADGRGPEAIQGVSIQDIGRAGSSVVSQYKDGFRIVREAAKRKAALYHFHDPVLLPACIWLKLQGHAVVYDAHEDTPMEKLTSEGLPLIKRLVYYVLFGTMEMVGAWMFDEVIAATPFIEKKFKRFTSRTALVANYPKVEEFEGSASMPSREHALCYVGAITKDRGIKEMMDVLGDFPGLKLNLAGPVDEGLLKELSLHPNWKSVEYLGVISRQEIVSVLNHSKIGLVILHPKKNYLEALPTKLFEYMLCGIPVIASNFKLWETLVEESGAGFCVDPFSREQLSSRIKHLLDNPEEAETMGKQGRRYVVENKNWKKEISRLLAVYERVIPPTK